MKIVFIYSNHFTMTKMKGKTFERTVVTNSEEYDSLQTVNSEATKGFLATAPNDISTVP